MTQIYHAHLYGTRDSKYDWLQNHDVLSTDWQPLTPQAPFYLLIPQNTDLLSEYEQGWKITDVMPVNSTGVKTHRDHFVIDFDAEILKSRIAEFRDLNIPDEVIAQRYSLSDTRDWKVNTRRRSLAGNQDWENYLTKCLYRPFDIRDYYHHQDVVELPRNEVMNHFLKKENIALICKRQSLEPEIRNYFSCSEEIVADGYFAADNKGRDNTFPLYLYPDRAELTNLSRDRRPNFSAQFLKIDFPRVPLTRNLDLFRQLAAYGEELVALHLMKSPHLDSAIARYEGNPAPVVDAGHPKFNPHPLASSPQGKGEQDGSAPLSRSGRGAGGEGGKVILNKKGDGFTGVPEEVWNFYVGGYQVCHKWLKDRKGRTLSPEDITHYQRIVVALQETIRLMQQIDAAIPGWPLA